MPAHNAQRTLERAVGSVLAQENIDLDVIIVDDASTDDTASIAGDLASDPRVSVVHRRDNAGPSGARNDGLRRAQAPLVLFLDADDELLPGALETLAAPLDVSDAVAVMGRFRAVDSDGDDLDIGTWANEQLRPVIRRRGAYVASPQGMSAEAMLTRLVTPPPGAVLVRRDAALRVGGFDVRAPRSEDLGFYVRLTSVGVVECVEHDVLRYQRGPAQRSANVRDRQWGRQKALASLIWHASPREQASARARGVVAHHLDRATTRWRFGERTPRDVLAVTRSLLLAGGFALVGLASTLRPT